MDLGVQVPGAGHRERWQGLKEAEGHSARWGRGRDRKRNQVVRARKASQTQPALWTPTSEKGSGSECHLCLRGPGAWSLG